jgi:hypothetical protein
VIKVLFCRNCGADFQPSICVGGETWCATCRAWFPKARYVLVDQAGVIFFPTSEGYAHLRHRFEEAPQHYEGCVLMLIDRPAATAEQQQGGAIDRK